MASNSIIIDTSLNTSNFENGLAELTKSIERQANSIINQFNFINVTINRSIEEIADESEREVDDTSKTITAKLGELASNSATVLKEKMGQAGQVFLDLGKRTIEFGDQYKAACNTLQTSTGATKDEMAVLGDAIKGVYADNFGKDMEDIAQSMAVVQQTLQGTGEDIQGATEKAIGFKDTFGVDVPESMGAVDTLMKQFGLTSDEAFNLMAQGQQKGLEFGENLIGNIGKYSEEFSKAGLSAEDMFNIMANSGESGEGSLNNICEAAKTLTTNLTDGSSSTKESLAAIGLNADEVASKMAQGGDTAKQTFADVVESLSNMDDKQAQSLVGSQLFGEKWGELGPDVCMQLANINGDFDKTKDTMDQINAVKYDTFGEAITGIGRQLETTFLLPIAEKVLPYLNDMANSMKDAFESEEISASVDNLAESIGKVIECIAGVVEEWLPKAIEALTWVLDNSDVIAAGIIGIGTAFEVFKVASLVMGLVEAFRAFKLAEEGATIATWLMNAAMAANPIGIVIAVIAGFIAALIYLWTTNEGFREAVIGAWNAICECATAVWGSICTFFTETIPEAFNSLVQFFTETVPEFFGTLWATICQLCIDGWNTVVAFFTETIPGFFTSLWASIYQFCSDGWNAIVAFFTESIPAWLESIGAFLAELPNKMAYGLGEVLAVIVSWCVNTWNYLATNVPLWISGIVNFFMQLPAQIMTWLSATLTNLVTWGSNMLLTATTAVSGVITAIVNFFMQLPTQIMTWLSTIITNLVTWGSNMLLTATTAVSSVITAIVNFFTQLPTQIMTWLSATVTNLATWGGNMLSTATTAMSTMVTGIIDTVTNLPSQMLTIGGNIVAGIKQGIEDAWKGLTGWIGGLCDSFVKGFEDKLDIHSPSRVFRDRIGKNIIKGIGVGIELETPNLEDQMDSNISNLTSKLQASVGYETARTTASISASANNAANVSSGTTNNNDNGINVNIENFNGGDKQNIEELAQEIAFLSKRKLV